MAIHSIVASKVTSVSINHVAETITVRTSTYTVNYHTKGYTVTATENSSDWLGPLVYPIAGGHMDWGTERHIDYTPDFDGQAYAQLFPKSKPITRLITSSSYDNFLYFGQVYDLKGKFVLLNMWGAVVFAEIYETDIWENRVLLHTFGIPKMQLYLMQTDDNQLLLDDPRMTSTEAKQKGYTYKDKKLFLI